MKINLLLDGHALSGYKNIDPYGYGDETKVVGDVENLHDIVEDAEATEILALDIIDFLPLDSIEIYWESIETRCKNEGFSCQLVIISYNQL